jgi:hypothetical protein
MIIWKLEKGLFQQSTLIQTKPVWKMNNQRMTVLRTTVQEQLSKNNCPRTTVQKWLFENSNKKPTKTIVL